MTGDPDPDFVSLDIVGGDLAMRRAVPFDRHRVGLRAIENNAARPDIGGIRRGAGHAGIEICGAGEIWRHRDL